mmetsp:Transcript_20379/g.38143  ORF Transcript_20379/g.38143 Transcript_20379/m.38143 type:complete len:1122 (-) Transcript_20379:1077-4442(-)
MDDPILPLTRNRSQAVRAMRRSAQPLPFAPKYLEQEMMEPKKLYLCVELKNSDKVMIKINSKTTTTLVLTRLSRYRQVRRIYGKCPPEKLALVLCVDSSKQPLPPYYKIFRLNAKGFWTRPFSYTNCPLLNLVDLAKPTDILDFTLPTNYNSLGDSLIDSSDFNWSTNSSENIAFKLKYTQDKTLKDWTGTSTDERYNEFIDNSPDSYLDSLDTFVVNIDVGGLNLRYTHILARRTSTLIGVLCQLQNKMKGVEAIIPDLEDMMLGFYETDELIFTWDCLLIHVDGIRELLLKKKIPQLLLLRRPIGLKSEFKEQAILKTYINDFVTSLVSTFIKEIKALETRDYVTHTLVSTRRLDKSNTFTWMRPASNTIMKIVHKNRSSFSTIIPSPLFKSERQIDVRSIELPLRIKVLGIENLRMYKIDKESGVPLIRLHPTWVTLEMSLYAGGVELEKTRHSTRIALSAKDINRQFNENIRWNEWVYFHVLYSELPLSTSVRVVVNAKVAKERKPAIVNEKCLGWVNFRIFDYARKLKTGIQKVGLYPRYAKQDLTGTTADNADPEACQLFLQIESFLQPVVYGDSCDAEFDLRSFADELLKPISEPHLKELSRLETQGPLYELSSNDCEILWRYRAYCTNHPKLLPKLFLSVDWCNPSNVRDIHKLIELCHEPSPIEALELLDGKYADDKVRAFGVKCLEKMSTHDFQLFLIQLVQAIKFEPYHDSPLLHFLLKRALDYPKRIGHYFFWLLKSEMRDPYFKERFGLLLEQYLQRCGPIKSSLVWQDYLVKNLEAVARQIQADREMPKEEQHRILYEHLTMLNASLPEVVTSPLNPKYVIRSFQIDECKVMKSKKRPLYLVFLRENYEPVHVLFKAGDDLRQDMLTLQAFKLMESLWLKNDLNLQLSLYGCLTMGNEVGMLEIVRESCTLADVHKWAGGQRAVFSEKTLLQWLKANATCEQAVDNFISSCAGYSIATYVLGVADRHNDNIMLRKTGQIFHIDFGHFLGYFKKKMGIKRETAPFVFTPDFAFAMGKPKSQGYEKFLRLAVSAYNILRHNSHLIYLLLALMLSSGITELTRKDLKYLEKTLIGGTDAAAEKHFRKLVVECMNNYMTRINFSIHIIANS